MMRHETLAFLSCILLFSASCSEKAPKDSEPEPTTENPSSDTDSAAETLRRISEGARTYYSDTEFEGALEFAKRSSGLRLEGHDDSEKTISLSIDAEGICFVHDKPIKLDQLAKYLQAQAEQNPELQLIIQASPETLHGRLVEIMDTAKSAGVEKVTINPQGKKGGNSRVTEQKSKASPTELPPAL